MTVTRVEIADLISEAFDYPPTDRSEILATAVRNGARTPVVELLGQLPEQPYPNLRSLWTHLEVPVDS